MRVYVLILRSAPALTRAFDRVMESRHVASCLIEPESGRLRFLAPPKAADELVAQIYEEGGLTWCSQHDLRPREDEAAENRPHVAPNP